MRGAAASTTCQVLKNAALLIGPLAGLAWKVQGLAEGAGGGALTL